MRQQVQSLSAAHRLLDVGPNDRDLYQHPQQQPRKAAVLLAAVLRQVAAGDDAQPAGHALEGGAADEHDLRGRAGKGGMLLVLKRETKRLVPPPGLLLGQEARP